MCVNSNNYKVGTCRKRTIHVQLIREKNLKSIKKREKKFSNKKRKAE